MLEDFLGYMALVAVADGTHTDSIVEGFAERKKGLLYLRVDDMIGVAVVDDETAETQKEVEVVVGNSDKAKHVYFQHLAGSCVVQILAVPGKMPVALHRLV